MAASPPSARLAVFRRGPATGVRYPPPVRPPNDRDRRHHAVPSDINEPNATSTDPGDVVVIGAGPAGLTAAYELGKRGGTATVLESDDVVGGISRTVEADGYRFDIGGHRFFTKVREVEALWHEILPDEDFLQRPRSSRIYYQGKYYDYPIKP